MGKKHVAKPQMECDIPYMKKPTTRKTMSDIFYGCIDVYVSLAKFKTQNVFKRKSSQDITEFIKVTFVCS